MGEGFAKDHRGSHQEKPGKRELSCGLLTAVPCCSHCALLLPLAYISAGLFTPLASKTPCANTPSAAGAGRGAGWGASEALASVVSLA